MTRAKKFDLIADTKKFVTWHLGNGCFAPHTGQDWPAWCAFVHLVQCWTVGGGELAITAMRATVRCAQATEPVLRTFVQTIPAIGDWSHVRELWPRIAEGIVIRNLGNDARVLCAFERHAKYDDESHKVVGTLSLTMHGWQAGSSSLNRWPPL